MQWAVVLTYTLMAWLLTSDETTAPELVWLATAGAVALIAILTAGWVWGAEDDEDR